MVDGLYQFWCSNLCIQGSPAGPVLPLVQRDCMVLLHGFIKKTQKTPKREFDLALKRNKGEGA